MKSYFKTLLIAIMAITGFNLFTGCSSNDNSAPEPENEYTKGKFVFCYGAPESELNYVHFEFKFTYLDEKGNEKSETAVVTKEGFTAQSPTQALQTLTDFRYYNYSISINSLPSTVKVETKIVLKSDEELTADKYDVGQSLFIYFLPDGKQYGQSWSSSSVSSKGVSKERLTTKLSSYQNSASKTFIIQKSGVVSEYK